jgi:hypothetical protein
MLDKVTALLNNPVIKQGLKLTAPQISTGIELLTLGGALFSTGRRGPSASDLMSDVDTELARQIEILADSTISAPRRRNTEVRVHTLLGLLNTWSKYR